MTTPSFFQSYGLSFEYGTNAALGDVTILSNLQREIVGYTHTNSAFMGFDKATITLSDNRLRLEEWLAYGIGRHVRIYGHDLFTIWEGFVNQISYSVGGVNVTVGPLTSVVNRASTTFSEVEENAETISGSTAVTIIEEDSDSQDSYGIWEDVINVGSMYRDEAEQVVSVFLQDKKFGFVF